VKWYILSAVQLADLKSLLGKLEAQETGVTEKERVVATARGILEDISQLTLVANL
jgi:hypothetical protein